MNSIPETYSMSMNPRTNERTKEWKMWKGTYLECGRIEWRLALYVCACLFRRVSRLDAHCDLLRRMSRLDAHRVGVGAMLK